VTHAASSSTALALVRDWHPGLILDQPRYVSGYLANASDPWALWWRARAEQRLLRTQLYVGLSDSGVVMTKPNSHLLAIGPSQHQAGKTSSIIIPNVAGWCGPVVSTSVKLDVARATAQIRASAGRVYHWRPDGAPLLEGAVELRWSPVQMGHDYDLCKKVSRLMVRSSQPTGMTESGGSHFFTQRATQLIAPILWLAHSLGKDMAWVIEVITLQDTHLVAPVAGGAAKPASSSDTNIWNLVNGLQARIDAGTDRSRGAAKVVTDLKGFLRTPSRQLGDVFATALVALESFNTDAAIDSTKRPNFDAEDFVRGEPFDHNNALELDEERGFPLQSTGTWPKSAEGFFDTIYITAAEPDDINPLVVAFLSMIRQTIQAVRTSDAAEGHSSRQPVLFALDELANISPLPDITRWLSVGNEGLVVLAALQDRNVAIDRWGELAKSFTTLFGNVVVFSGLMDVDLLEELSKLAGDKDVERQSYTEGRTTSWTQGSSTTRSTTTSLERWPRLPIDRAIGGIPDQPDRTLYFSPISPGIPMWFIATPYYRSQPWIQMMVKSALLARRRSHIVRGRMPLPALDRDTNEWLQKAGLHQEWRQLKADWPDIHREAERWFWNFVDKNPDFRDSL